MKYEVGMSVKSISNPLTLEAVDAIGRSGLKTLETNPCNFACSEPEKVLEAFVEMTEKAGKRTPTYHCPYGTDWDLSSVDEAMRKAAMERLVGLFPQAHRLSAGILVEHPSWEPVAEEERPARIASLRKSLEELSPVLKKEGFRMAMEDLPRTCLGHTAEELMAILEGLDDTFGVCFDVNHLNGRSAGIPDAVRLFGKRLYCLHISDYYGGDECHLVPGDGVIDWRAFNAALCEIGYEGDYNYEVRIPDKTAGERCACVVKNFNEFMSPFFKWGQGEHLPSGGAEVRAPSAGASGIRALRESVFILSIGI